MVLRAIPVASYTAEIPPHPAQALPPQQNADEPARPALD
jgi:hypothetical protein